MEEPVVVGLGPAFPVAPDLDAEYAPPPTAPPNAPKEDAAGCAAGVMGENVGAVGGFEAAGTASRKSKTFFRAEVGAGGGAEVNPDEVGAA